MRRTHWLVPALSVTLVTSWGTLYYAFAVLGRPIQAELGWSAQLTVGAYSLALLVAGLGAYPVGKFIDRHGGRHLMTLGSGIAAALFLMLSQTESVFAFYAIWFGLGIAMAMTLYEPAFAVIVATFPHGYRKRIAILTLTGGLASTVFWPLTHLLVTSLGWRHAAMVLGAIHLAVCAPLHWLTLPATEPKAPHPPASEMEVPAPITPRTRKLMHDPSFWLLTFCFMAFGLTTAAMAVHVIPLLESRGLGASAAVALAALIGPMQVSGRFVDVLFGSRVPALALGAVTMAMIPLALTTMLFGSMTPLLYVFVVLYGAGLGLITIVRATTPTEIFGRERYASVSGAIAGPSIMARAAGPFAATAVLTAFGDYNAVLILMLAVVCAGAVSYWLGVAMHTKHR